MMILSYGLRQESQRISCDMLARLQANMSGTGLDVSSGASP